MNTRESLGARRRSGWKPTLGVVAILAAAAACDGAAELNSPEPDLPAPPVSEPPVPASQPVQIVKISGDGQEGRPGDQLKPIIVAVRDPSGRPVPGVRVRFSVTAGDGFVALIRVSAGGDEWLARFRGPADQVTDRSGEAAAFWFIGRNGENTLGATVESEGRLLEVNFRATSVSSAYAGGSFALKSNGTSIKLVDGLGGGPYDCDMRSGSLVLSPDGSFEGKSDFNCQYGSPYSLNFTVIETGFYAVFESTIVLHYLESNDTAGFFWDRDAQGVMSGDTIVFSSMGVEWRYARLDAMATP